MILLSVDQFMHLMRSNASGLKIAAQADLLLDRLRVAYEALMPYAPTSVHPIAAPWPEPALAFEARWADGRALVAATRELAAGSLDSQITLAQHGITKFSVLTAHKRLADGVVTCLGPVTDR